MIFRMGMSIHQLDAFESCGLHPKHPNPPSFEFGMFFMPSCHINMHVCLQVPFRPAEGIRSP